MCNGSTCLRSTFMQVWAKLCQHKTIPLNRQHRLLRLVIGRLQDRSSTVRKQAVQLLTALLQCNPFTASMTVDDLRQQLQKETEELKRLMPDEEEEAERERWELVARRVPVRI